MNYTTKLGNEQYEVFRLRNNNVSAPATGESQVSINVKNFVFPLLFDNVRHRLSL